MVCSKIGQCLEGRLGGAALPLLFLSLTLGTGCSRSVAPAVTVTDLNSGIDERLIGVSVVDSSVIWVSGTGGMVGLTTDGGNSWNFAAVPSADSLQFRDIEAWDERRARVLSIGPGSQSRIYRTEDGGGSWTLEWTNADPKGFFDCFDFWSWESGLAVGDATDGRIDVVRSDGIVWAAVPDTALPEAHEGEGAFAASGTCLFTARDSLAWIVTGSAAGSRIYRTVDRGSSWSHTDTDFFRGLEAAGLMTLGFRGSSTGFAAGGALRRPDDNHSNFAFTADGGVTWIPRTPTQLPNVYGIAVSPSVNSSVILAVGPKGMDVSHDDGREWTSVDKRNYWSVRFVNDETAIAVGPSGRISRVVIGMTSGS